MAAPGSVLHHGHSSVTVLEDGSLFEIRRGHDRFWRIHEPYFWTSLDAWMHDADALSYTSRAYRNHWNADQMFVAQWLPKSNLQHTMSSATTVHAARETLRQARNVYDHCLHRDISCGARDLSVVERSSARDMPSHQRDQLYAWVQTCEGHVAELERGSFQIVQPFSEILVVDATTGFPLPLFMNLEMGVLGIRRFTPGSLNPTDPNVQKGRMMTVWGYSFEELGIVPSEVYKYEMGGYFRIQ